MLYMSYSIQSQQASLWTYLLTKISIMLPFFVRSMVA
jgi:hypothetical protein